MDKGWNRAALKWPHPHMKMPALITDKDSVGDEKQSDVGDGWFAEDDGEEEEEEKKGKAASWLVNGTFNAAAALHSDVEWRSGWPEEGRFSGKTSRNLEINPEGIYRRLHRVLSEWSDGELVAGWEDCGSQSVLGDRSSAASHCMKCVTVIRFSHLHFSAPHARTVPRTDHQVKNAFTLNYKCKRLGC